MSRERTLDNIADNELLSKSWKRVKFGNVVNQIKDRLKEPETAGIQRYIAGRHFTSASLKLNGFGKFGDGMTGPAFHMRVKEGQILFVSRRAYLRKVAIAEFEAICSNIVYVMEANGTELIQAYLPFLMQSESFVNFAINNSKGSTNPYLNWKDIAEYEFLLPPIKKQQRISCILWEIEKSIGQVDEVIGKTQRLKKALMQKLLTKGIGHTEFKETKLGVIPETWKIKRLKDISISGSQNGLYKSKDDGDPVNYVGMTEIFKSDILTKDIEKTINVTQKEREKFSLKNGDLLFGRRSLKVEGAGKCVLVSGLITDTVFESSIIRFSLNKEIAEPLFYLYWFLGYIGSKTIRRIVRVVTVSGVTGKDLERVIIPLPPLSEQKKIASILFRADETLVLLRKHREVYVKLKKRTLNDLIK